eukprot:7713041-Pyramimonas_sp.AAC.2
MDRNPHTFALWFAFPTRENLLQPPHICTTQESHEPPMEIDPAKPCGGSEGAAHLRDLVLRNGVELPEVAPVRWHLLLGPVIRDPQLFPFLKCRSDCRRSHQPMRLTLGQGGRFL